MKKLLMLLALLAANQQALAAQLDVEIEIPRLQVAEYHRPYVAIWLEQNGKQVANLAVWYDGKLKDKEGEKWLKDMRQWWRKSGRTLEFPIDGVSGATRAPGRHQISVKLDEDTLGKLQAGEFHVFVEAAREVGGRELIRIPLQWPVKQTLMNQAQGSHELGLINATLIP